MTCFFIDSLKLLFPFRIDKIMYEVYEMQIYIEKI